MELLLGHSMHEFHMHNLYACPSDETNKTWTKEHPFNPLSLCQHIMKLIKAYSIKKYLHTCRNYTLWQAHMDVLTLCHDRPDRDNA